MIQSVTGESREPYVTEPVTDYREQAIAEVERFPSIQLSSVIEGNRTAGHQELNSVSIHELTATLQRAGQYFAEGDVGPSNTGPEEYIRNVVRVTGLPITTVRSAVETIRQTFENVESAIRAQTPSTNLRILDDLYYESPEKTTIGYVPKGHNLGLLAPSNHPAVLSLALVAYAMKYPLAIRPSDGDPFTPARIVHALHEAGVPEESAILLPGDREVGTKILEQSDLAMGFGGEQLQRKYASSPGVKIHGPGNSKVFVDADYAEQVETIDRLEEAMMADGGRGCINMSQIVTTGDAETIANRLAQRIKDVPVRSPLDEDSRIPALSDPDQAHRLDQLLTTNLSSPGAEDVTELYDSRPRVIEQDGATFLRPTVVLLDWSEFENGTHDLFQEFPFQYASVVAVPESEVVTALSDSLAVTLLSDSRDLERRALKEPSIEKLYANGELTCDIDLLEPHQGYISDFLYKKQAYRPSV